ncbi:helix-turn-helix domain-containing protein [Caulobacter sp. SLTY]|nr:helix-turn-helix domain-containing protein [Caulobacter sp. SLTY]
MTQPSLLTFDEVCGKLRVSQKTLRSIIARGELPALKVGAAWRIRSDDFSKYIETPCPSISAAQPGTTTSRLTASATAVRPVSNSRRTPTPSLTRTAALSSWELHLQTKSRPLAR